MKTLKFLKTIGIAISATVLMYACKPADPPIITLEAPEDGAVFYAGYDVHFATMLADSIGLASYGVQITDKEEKVTCGWTWDLPDVKEQFIHHHEIIIPKDAVPGDYIFTITCKNKKGKTSRVSKNIGIITP